MKNLGSITYWYTFDSFYFITLWERSYLLLTFWAEIVNTRFNCWLFVSWLYFNRSSILQCIESHDFFLRGIWLITDDFWIWPGYTFSKAKKNNYCIHRFLHRFLILFIWPIWYKDYFLLLRLMIRWWWYLQS